MNENNSVNDPFLETMARLRARAAQGKAVPAAQKPAAVDTASAAVNSAPQEVPAVSGGNITPSSALADLATRLRAKGGAVQAAKAAAAMHFPAWHTASKDAHFAPTAAGGAQNQEADPAAPAAKLLQGLNPRQYEAVVYHGGHLLVVAGAGSGKTRVLTTRIAYLIAAGQAQASEILAITFTNKAAKEMRERLTQLLGASASRMWISTFHSACVRILRAEHEAIGYRAAFTIYDQADSQRLLKIVCAEDGIESKQLTPKILAHRISDLKNELITPAQAMAQAADRDAQIVARAYTGYQNRLTAANAMDFDDLIFKTVLLLQQNPLILDKYQRWFRHILVDEYQDTNPAQYELIRILAAPHAQLPPAQLTVVGDADQSIYAFRGATIRNIENFESDFPNAHTVLLEQNYRSTQNILHAANALISNNDGRRAKNLWTDSGAGAKLVGYVASSERDEAAYIVDEIQKIHAQGETAGQQFHYRDFAIFYRANAQSRVIEDLLMRAGIPYKVVGGTKFYDRKEIKDAIAYLQAVANPDDTVSLRRIFNEPKRGLGAKAESQVALTAQAAGISFGAALQQLAAQDKTESALSARALNSLQEFAQLLQSAREKAIAGEAPAEILDYLMDESGYLQALQSTNDPQDDVRVENIAQLRAVAADFLLENPQSSLDDFLGQISLVSDTDQIPDAEDNDGQVVLMTVHTAKGLEFPVVFVTGLEEGTFPHVRAMNSLFELSEERRLAYVALTRARQKLYLTRAASRTQWGALQDLPASRFLAEIPAEVIEWEQSKLGASNFGGGGYGSGAAQGDARSNWATHFAADSWKDDDFAPAYGSGIAQQNQPFKAEKLGVAAAAAGKRGADADFAQEANLANTPVAASGFKVGDRVRHKSFGVGKVIGFEGQGKSAVAKVRFNSGATKRLMLRFAPLEKIS